jgi:hypothetical protein
VIRQLVRSDQPMGLGGYLTSGQQYDLKYLSLLRHFAFDQVGQSAALLYDGIKPKHRIKPTQVKPLLGTLALRASPSPIQ